MMRKRTTIVAAAAALIWPGPAAVAQQDQAAAPALDVRQLREFDRQMVERLGVTVDELEDMDIIGPDGEEIGEIEDVLVDPQGDIVAVSAKLGGVLGVGDREVVLRLDQLGLEQGRRNVVVSMTRAEIDALPVWDD